MSDRYTFTGKDGVERTFVGDRPPTPAEMSGIENAETKTPDTSSLDRLSSILSSIKDVGVGATKGAANTVLDAGQLVRSIPGVSTVTDAVGNAVGGVAGQALYGTKSGPANGDAAFQKAKDKTTYQNTSQAVGGGLEALTELLAPVSKAAEMIPSAERAGKTFQTVMGAARNVPVDVTAPGQVALRIQELADRGASMPMAVRKFLNRVTSPSGGPFTYEEARDFASNISRLSANEYSRLSPVVAREVAGLRVALNGAVADAAKTAGKGAEYAAAMKEYAQAQKIKGAMDEAWQGAKRAFPYAGGAGVGLYLGQKLKDLLGGQ